MKVKFLIIRFSSIGDIVLTSPVVRCLKEQVDNAEIYFATKAKHASIVENNPAISKVFLLKGKLSSLIEELGAEQFDYIIDLHQNIRSARIKQRLKVPAFSFNKLNYRKWLFVNLKMNTMPDLHIVDRYLKTVQVFDVKNDGKGLDYFIDNKQLFDFSSLPKTFQPGFVAFVVAGTYPTKCLPKEKVLEICNKIGKPVILLGGKNEEKEAEYIVKNSTGNIANLCGKTSLNESAQVIKEANVVLTNDTGLMHVAAAFKKKILSFWGNTAPEFGMYPYFPHPGSKIMEVENLKCRPCSKLGFEKCPKKHFKCMQGIETNNVLGWVEKHF